MTFGSTMEVEPSDGIAGQEGAVEALAFGLSIQGHGQHVFLRSQPSTGRVTLVKSVIERIGLPNPADPDRCYVHNFDRPDAPKLVTLPPSQGPVLRDRIAEMIRFIREDLPDLLGSARVLDATRTLEEQAAAELRELSRPIDEAVAAAGLGVVQLESEDGSSETWVIPVIDGQPLPFEQLEAMPAEQRPIQGDLDQLKQEAVAFSKQLRQLSASAIRVKRRGQKAIRMLVTDEVRGLMQDAVADIRRGYPELEDWLDGVVADVTAHIAELSEEPRLANRYRVNVLQTRVPGGPPPVVVENVPTLQRLLGGVDPVADQEQALAPHMGIHSGSLLQASGGVLILRAREVYSEPGAWAALKRTLRTQRIELTPAEHHASTVRYPGVKPEPLKFRVKVVLIGDPLAYHVLNEGDDDFSQLFKVLVDVSDVLPLERRTVNLYGQVVARLAATEDLPPFTGQAVGALAEHGARVAAQPKLLTARFGRIADIAREAAWHAKKRGVDKVHRQDVEHSVLAGKRRADRPGRRFRKRVAAGIMKVWTEGAVVGQVNGLAVVQAGPLTYGFPTRVTATVGPGEVGAIHVEREANLSGQLHTKGFLILRGLLRKLLATPHPLVFDASLTHEQSYGGIDGDSASGAEFACLVSALTDVPVRQGIAMTGAVDQHGHVQPIGAVNEKIEGFFDLCAHLGLDGTQGVIIPDSNVGDLQLRRDVVEACRGGRFHVWAVGHIRAALTLFTGMEAGTPDADGGYPAETLLGMARARAETLWLAAGRTNSLLP